MPLPTQQTSIEGVGGKMSQLLPLIVEAISAKAYMAKVRLYDMLYGKLITISFKDALQKCTGIPLLFCKRENMTPINTAYDREDS